MRRAVLYVEIDTPSFVEASPAPSPDPGQTWRFARDTDWLPTNIDAIPSIQTVQFSPATISLGQNLGQRASLNVSFRDHPHVMGGEAFTSGTFWGKWRGRYGTRLRGQEVRLYRGFEGDALADMDTRYYVLESVNGPTPQGIYTVTAKDILKLADNDRAQAPAPSNGFLSAAIGTGDTSASLSPAGIGNAEYPSSGHVAIGGEEICSFTRVDDTLTLTRGQLGTTAAEHDQEDRVQLVLRYSGADPADIISDLLQTYAEVPASYIPLAAWRTETDSFLQRLYGATIPEPVGVNTLVSELIEQAGLAVWWDDSGLKVRLQVLRAISTTADTFNEDTILANSLQVADQPDKRLSQVWTYYGQRNSLRPIDEVDNFRSLQIDLDAGAEADYGGAAIKKIYARWIPAFSRTTAQRLNNIQLGRFIDPPRKFSFALLKQTPLQIMLGGGYRLGWAANQDSDGAAALAPVQVTRLDPGDAELRVEAQEMLFTALDPVDLENRVITIDSNINDVNLRTLHDEIYPEPEEGVSPGISVTCIVAEGAIVGATSTAGPAFDVGTWPAGVTILIIVRGRIQGAGGVGGDATPTDGGDGGPALYSRTEASLEMDGGELWGGGGGGGGSANPVIGGGGGGGAGQLPGTGGMGSGSLPAGQDGTTEAGGEGQDHPTLAIDGDGGDPGQAGEAGVDSGRPGGAAGFSIDSVGTISILADGDIRGPQDAAESDKLWHCDINDDVYELETEDFSTLRTVASPTTIQPRDIGGDGDTIWCCDLNELYELSPSDFSIVMTASTPAISGTGMGGKTGTVWHANSDGDDVYELDPDDFSTIRSAASPSTSPRGIGGSASAIWHADTNTNTVYQLSVSDFSVVQSVASPDTDPSGMGGTGSRVWHCDLGGTLYELDPDDLSVIRSAASPDTLPDGIGGT